MTNTPRETREWEKEFEVGTMWRDAISYDLHFLALFAKDSHQGNLVKQLEKTLDHFQFILKKSEDLAVERATEQLRVAFMDLQGEYGAEEEYAEKEWKHLLNHRRIELPLNPPGDEKGKEK